MSRLSSIRFKDLLHAWSISMVLSQKKIPYKSRYEMVPVGSLVDLRDQHIVINNEENYVQLKVKTNGGGVEARSEEKVSGRELKTRRQTKVKAGQFIFSKIDARNGAVGIIPQHLEGAIVTAEFPVFDVDKKLVLPEYLQLVMSSESVTDYIKSIVRGSTNRKRLDVATFRAIRIPLPSLDEQKQMLKTYHDSIRKIEKREHELETLPKRMQEKLNETTGVRIKKAEGGQGLRAVSFSNTKNWSVESTVNAMIVSSDYPMRKIGDFVDSFMWDGEGNSLRMVPKLTPDKEFLYVGMENIEKGIGKLTCDKLKQGGEIKSSALRIPSGFFLFGRLRPNLNKYWRNESKDLYNIVCSTEFMVFSIKEDEQKDYFEYVLSSDLVQAQIKQHITGTGLPRVNPSDFLEVRVPAPPMQMKRQLGKYFKENQRKLWDANQFIATERTKALKEFESQIFEKS